MKDYILKDIERMKEMYKMSFPYMDIEHTEKDLGYNTALQDLITLKEKELLELDK